MKRRDLIKGLTLLPVAGSLVPFKAAAAAPLAPGLERDLFKELGVRTFINAAGTYTFMTGSLMHDYVVMPLNLHQQNFVCSMICRIK